MTQGEAVAMLRQLLERAVGAGMGWQPIEAVLYCIRSMAEAIEPTEATHTPAIVAILPDVRRIGHSSMRNGTAAASTPHPQPHSTVDGRIAGGLAEPAAQRRRVACTGADM